MNQTIRCDIHGEQKETFVCRHILEDLRKGSRSGFIWTFDEDGGFQAFCEECDQRAGEMSDAEWDEFVPTIITMLCLGCFKQAAELNNVILKNSSS